MNQTRFSQYTDPHKQNQHAGIIRSLRSNPVWLKEAVFLCAVIFLLSGWAFTKPGRATGDDQYVNVDNGVSVKFKGTPQRYFYQTPMGDLTIYEYKPETSLADSNFLYSVAIYKPPVEEASNQLEVETIAKYNSLISSEETAIGSLKGKIIERSEYIFEGRQAIKYKVLFRDLAEMDQIEGQKDVIYNVRYIKCKGQVVKIWTYTTLRNENKNIDLFFNSLKINK